MLWAFFVAFFQNILKKGLLFKREWIILYLTFNLNVK